MQKSANLKEVRSSSSQITSTKLDEIKHDFNREIKAQVSRLRQEVHQNNGPTQADIEKIVRKKANLEELYTLEKIVTLKASTNTV